MARTRASSRGKKNAATSPAATRSKGRSKSKSKSKAGASKTSLLVTPDQALLVNIVFQTFYALAFFGLTGKAAHLKFFGTEATAGPLCNSVPFWAGLCNLFYVANAVHVLYNGSASEKAHLCMVRRNQWAVWFCMMMLSGHSGFHGAFVPMEYFAGVAVCFIACVLSRHGAEGAKLESSVIDYSSVAGKTFLFLIFSQLFNTFNVGVMSGEQYFASESENVTATCRIDTGFFASFIFLLTADLMHVMQVQSKKNQKMWFQIQAAFNAIFIAATFMHSENMPVHMTYVNYGLNAITLALAANAANSL